VASDNTGPISISFSTPVSVFAAYFTYGEAITVTAFGFGGQELTSVHSGVSDNEALSGTPGSSPNELLDVGSAAGIYSITIAGDPGGGSFVMDDATYKTTIAAVPEAGTDMVVCTGAIFLLFYRSRQVRFKRYLANAVRSSRGESLI